MTKFQPNPVSENTNKIPSKFNPLMEPKSQPGRVDFIEKIYEMSVKRGHAIKSVPMMKQKPLDIYSIYLVVKELGGVELVENSKKWPDVVEKLKQMEKLPSVESQNIHNTCQHLKKAYCRYIIDFEAVYDRQCNADVLLQKIDGKRLPPKKEKRPDSANLDPSRYEEEFNEASNHSSISHTNSLSLPPPISINSNTNQSQFSNPPSVKPPSETSEKSKQPATRNPSQPMADPMLRHKTPNAQPGMPSLQQQQAMQHFAQQQYWQRFGQPRPGFNPQYPGYMPRGYHPGMMQGHLGQPPSKMPRMDVPMHLQNHPIYAGRGGAPTVGNPNPRFLGQPNLPPHLAAKKMPEPVEEGPKSPSQLVVEKYETLTEKVKDSHHIKSIGAVLEPKKFHAKDINKGLGVDCFRLTMALKSNIQAEVTWALRHISVLLADDNSIKLFNFAQQHELFDTILDCYKRSLLDFIEVWEADLNGVKKVEEADDSPILKEIETELLQHRGLKLDQLDHSKFGPNHTYKIIKASDENIINRSEYWDRLDIKTQVSQKLKNSTSKTTTPFDIFGEKVTTNFDTTSTTPFSTYLGNISSLEPESTGKSSRGHKSTDKDKEDNEEESKLDKNREFQSSHNQYFYNLNDPLSGNQQQLNKYRKYRHERAVITKEARIYNPFPGVGVHLKHPKRKSTVKTEQLHAESAKSSSQATEKQSKTSNSVENPEPKSTTNSLLNTSNSSLISIKQETNIPLCQKVGNFYDDSLVFNNSDPDNGYDSESIHSESIQHSFSLLKNCQTQPSLHHPLASTQINQAQMPMPNESQTQPPTILDSDSSSTSNATNNPSNANLPVSPTEFLIQDPDEKHHPTLNPLDLKENLTKPDVYYLPEFTSQHYPGLNTSSYKNQNFSLNFCGTPKILNSVDLHENSDAHQKIYQILVVSNILKSLSCIPDNRFYFSSQMQVLNLLSLFLKRKLMKQKVFNEIKLATKQPPATNSPEVHNIKLERPNKPETPSESSSHDSGMDDKNLDDLENSNQGPSNSDPAATTTESKNSTSKSGPPNSQTSETSKNFKRPTQLTKIPKNYKISPILFQINKELENDSMEILNNIALTLDLIELPQIILQNLLTSLKKLILNFNEKSIYFEGNQLFDAHGNNFHFSAIEILIKLGIRTSNIDAIWNYFKMSDLELILKKLLTGINGSRNGFYYESSLINQVGGSNPLDTIVMTAGSLQNLQAQLTEKPSIFELHQSQIYRELCLSALCCLRTTQDNYVNHDNTFYGKNEDGSEQLYVKIFKQGKGVCILLNFIEEMVYKRCCFVQENKNIIDRKNLRRGY